MTKNGNSEIFRQFAWKNRISSLEKSKFFVILPGKPDFFLPGSPTPRFQTRLTPLTLATIGPTFLWTAWPVVCRLKENYYFRPLV